MKLRMKKTVVMMKKMIKPRIKTVMLVLINQIIFKIRKLLYMSSDDNSNYWLSADQDIEMKLINDINLNNGIQDVSE